MRRTLTLLLLALALASCNAAPTTQADALTPTPASAAVAPSRCVAVTGQLAQALNNSLTITGGGTVDHLYAVRSNDYSKAWFVSGQLHGSGMDGIVATWMTNDLAGNGSIFSAEAMAKEFSHWMPKQGVSSSDDGFAESYRCAKDGPR